MSDDDVTLPIGSPTAPRSAAMICAVGSFLFSFGESHSRTVNGVVVESGHHDYVAIAGGGLAVVLGGVALAFAVRRTSDRNKELGLAALAVGLGLYHVVVRSGFVF